jgi:hypothetical protein
MKQFKLLLTGCLAVLFFSCSDDDAAAPVGDTALFAVPIFKSLAEIRSDVGVTAARQTDSDGKIYVSQNYLFYIAQEEGIHVFNNQNPSSPQNVAFINVAGVHDIAIKGDYLFADNFVDLLVFDISDFNNITLAQTVENTINYSPIFPTTAEYYDYTVTGGPNDLLTGFVTESRTRPTGDQEVIFTDAMGGFEAANGGDVGTGGSYAKFQINQNALYTVDSFQLNVFNIANPVATFYDKAVYMQDWFGGGQFETLFKQKDFLFVGATNGMHIVNAEDDFNPVFVSGFSHATACDPVVVSQNTAYITVRGGSTCGAIEDQVNVIDISNITSPTLLSSYMVDQPYGVGILNDALYVCCGSNGLKVFDASNSTALQLMNTYDESVTDVIPLGTHLIAVGANKIIQYSYGLNYTLLPLSEVNF